jgi:hypothetical protein
VRKANPSDRKLILQLIHLSPFKAWIPMVDVTSGPRNTVKTEYFAKAFKLSKRGWFRNELTPQAVTKISEMSASMSHAIEAIGTAACKSYRTKPAKPAGIKKGQAFRGETNRTATNTAHPGHRGQRVCGTVMIKAPPNLAAT